MALKSQPEPFSPIGSYSAKASEHGAKPPKTLGLAGRRLLCSRLLTGSVTAKSGRRRRLAAGLPAAKWCPCLACRLSGDRVASLHRQSEDERKGGGDRDQARPGGDRECVRRRTAGEG